MKDKGLNNKSMTRLVLLNTNARSLCPKINSFLDCCEEMKASISIITETWLSDGQSLDDDLQDLEHGAGIKFLVKNRKPGVRGVTHGGVAIAFKTGAADLKKLDFSNEHDYEVLVAGGTVPGHARKLVVIAAYVPPNYSQARGIGCLDYISDVVMQIKRKYKDPYIVIGGDFNQWDVADALEDYPDVREVCVGPTREDRAIDRMFVSFRDDVEAFGTLEPLETDDGSKKSDHRIAYLEADLARSAGFEWITYSYRFYNEAAVKLFGEWVVGQDWAAVVAGASSDEKTTVYQNMISAAIDSYFPLITTKRKSTDLPWINWSIRKKIKARNRLYRLQGRSAAWKRLKKVIEGLIAKRKEKFRIVQVNNLTSKDANRSFFKNVKSYGTKDRPKPFDVTTLCPGKTDAEVAEMLADYFNSVSKEFTGLSEGDVPSAVSTSLPRLSIHEVAGRIRKFRKPCSMVRGDVFPELVTRFADFFAVPLCSIYNKITTSKVWPTAWKMEHVTVIPKTSCPADFSGLRNICLLYTSPSPRDRQKSRMPSSA